MDEGINSPSDPNQILGDSDGDNNYFMEYSLHAPELKNIQVVSSICSFGNTVVQKIQVPEEPYYDSDQQCYVYKFRYIHT